MSRARHVMRARHCVRALPPQWLRQILAGLVAIPLSALPFLAYTSFTPEGRLVRDRALVSLWRPTLPTLEPADAAAAAAAAPRYDGSVMALAYHGIGSASDGEGGFVISPGRFAEQLATLQAAGMRTVTAAQVATAFHSGSPLPSKAVMISFDDGRTDAMLYADPLLADAHMTATMFVIAGAAEKPGVYYASWDKLEGYARSGRWDLESHTATLHREQKVAGGGALPALTSLAPGESLHGYRARVRADLARASATIERHVGRAPVAFAYPFGAYGAERTNDPGIQGVLREEVTRRYAVAFHQDDQGTVPLLGREEDRLGLRRLEVGDWSGLDLVRRIGRAADRTPVANRAPVADPGAQQPGPASAPGGAVTEPLTTVPAVGAAVPGRPPAPGVKAPPRRGPPSRVPPASAPHVGTTAPPTTGSLVLPPPPSTALPPTTSPPTVTTTTTVPRPTTTTTTTSPPTTTTTTTSPTTTTTTTTTTTSPPTTAPPPTVPRGCRSHGQGNVCSSQGGG